MSAFRLRSKKVKVTAAGSYFLEVPVLDDSTPDLRPQLPEDVHLHYIGHTPPVDLPKALRFYVLRPHVGDREIIETHSFFRTALIGETWEEVAYKPYRFRDHVLQASVAVNGGGQMRVPLAKVIREQTLTETVAYPPGVFAGDDVPTFEIGKLLKVRVAAEGASAELRKQLDSIETAVRGSNELPVEARAELLVALRECQQLALLPAVDHRRIATLLQKAQELAIKVGQGVIAKAIWDGLQWLWKNWMSLPG